MRISCICAIWCYLPVGHLIQIFLLSNCGHWTQGQSTEKKSKTQAGRRRGFITRQRVPRGLYKHVYIRVDTWLEGLTACRLHSKSNCGALMLTIQWSFFWSPPPTEPLFVIFVAINRRNMLKPQNLGFIFWDKFTTTENSEWFSSSIFAMRIWRENQAQSKLVKLPRVKLAVWGSFAVELQPFFRNTLPRSARGRWLGPPVRVRCMVNGCAM